MGQLGFAYDVFGTWENLIPSAYAIFADQPKCRCGRSGLISNPPNSMPVTFNVFCLDLNMRLDYQYPFPDRRLGIFPTAATGNEADLLIRKFSGPAYETESISGPTEIALVELLLRSARTAGARSPTGARAATGPAATASVVPGFSHSTGAVRLTRARLSRGRTGTRLAALPRGRLTSAGAGASLTSTRAGAGLTSTRARASLTSTGLTSARTGTGLSRAGARTRAATLSNRRSVR